MNKVPNISNVQDWLKKLNIDSYSCPNCQALHLSHLQNIDYVYDAKIDVIDDVIIFTMSAEIKASAILTISSELSQINANTMFIKAYLELLDNADPKIIFSYALNSSESMSFSQFSLFMSNVEDEALQLISELSSCDLLDRDESLKARPQEKHTQTFH